MKTYQFRAVIEPDEGGWIAFCPTLARQGAVTGGDTREEAHKNIREVLRMALESLIEHDEPIPDNEEAAGDEELIAVTV